MILQQKRGLLFGALDERSLAWKVAKRCLEEGANIVLTNTPIAAQLGTVTRLAEEHGVPFLPADATDPEELKGVLLRAQELLGGKIDFVLHAVAQSQNLRRHRSYDHLNYDYLLQTLDTSALSFHKLTQTAMQLDAIEQGGSIVTLTYIASERFFEGYNDMADAKALLESMVRQLGAVYGKRKGVRINAVSQSAVPTKASEHWEGREVFYRYADELAPLGAATAEDCADLCVALFSDLTRKLTMQVIHNDGGFSNMLMNYDLLDKLKYSYNADVQ